MDKQNPHFTNRARGGFTAAAMIEVIEAEQEDGRVPLLSNARLKVTEGVEYDPQTGEPNKGWIATAKPLAEQRQFANCQPARQLHRR